MNKILIGLLLAMLSSLISAATTVCGGTGHCCQWCQADTKALAMKACKKYGGTSSCTTQSNGQVKCSCKRPTVSNKSGLKKSLQK